MTIIQILGVLFAVFAFSRVFLRYKDKKINNGEFIFWTIVWVLVGVISIVPSILNTLTKPLGVGRPIDFVVYAGILALFYLVFRVYVKMDNFENQMTQVVRKVAIDEGKKKKVSKKK